MIYMIHLRTNRERYEWIQTLPIPFIIFDAIDTVSPQHSHQYDDLLSPEATEAVAYADRTGHKYDWTYMTRGAIGCYLSHVSLWRFDDHPFRIILEDDVKLLPGFSLHHLTLWIKYAPVDWDILLFSYKNRGQKDVGPYCRIRSFFGLQFYVIRQHVIDKLTLFPIRKQIDGVLSEASTNVVIYGIHPPLATSNYELKTTIQLPRK
jgi:GR25 family glycosyltransferase involved in LPS biosynthesis